MSQQMIKGSLNQKIVSSWKKHETEKVKNARTEYDLRQAKSEIYTKIAEDLKNDLKNFKEPRAEIRRAVNTHIFGYRPKKV